MKKVAKKIKGVIGIDEVGRGPLAGPVTVCAFYIKDEKRVRKEIFSDSIRDSKKLTKGLRYRIYQTIRNKRYLNTKLIYAVSSRDAAFIDAYGISKATRSCVLSCMRSLSKQGIDIEDAQINLDAGLAVPIKNLRQQSFVKGDEKFTEIALASIMAKVTRDMYMERLAKRHNEYGWERNVGYGTKDHREAIRNVGITKYHRRTFLKAFELFDNKKSMKYENFPTENIAHDMRLKNS